MAGGFEYVIGDNEGFARFVATGTSAFEYDENNEMQRRVTTTDVFPNTTVTSRKPTSAGDLVFYLYYYGLMGVLTLVNLTGNSAVISSILRHRQLRLPGNYFLFSIACSDMLLGIIYPISNVSYIDRPEIRRVFGTYT